MTNNEFSSISLFEEYHTPQSIESKSLPSISSTSSSLENWSCYNEGVAYNDQYFPLTMTSDDNNRLAKDPQMIISFPGSDNVNNGANTNLKCTSKVLKNRHNQWILFAEKNKNVLMSIKIASFSLEDRKLEDYRIRLTPVSYLNRRKSPVTNLLLNGQKSSFIDFRGFDMISNQELSTREDEIDKICHHLKTYDGFQVLEVDLPNHLIDLYSNYTLTIPMNIAFPFLNTKCIGKTKKDIYLLVELLHKDKRLCCSQFFVNSCACPTRDSDRYIKRNISLEEKTFSKRDSSASCKQYVVTTDDENIFKTLLLIKDQMTCLKKKIAETMELNKTVPNQQLTNEDFFGESNTFEQERQQPTLEEDIFLKLSEDYFPIKKKPHFSS